MRRRLLIFVTLAVVAAAATFAAVSGASFTTASSTAVRAATAPLSGDTLRADSGDGQVATAGAAVATAPSVKVTDTGGNPVSGVSVTFAVASGGGSVTGASAVTDRSGVAAAGSWTLGTVAGANTLTASSGSLSGSPVTFTATGTSGDAAQLIIETAADGSGSAIAGRSVTAGTAFTGYAVTRDAYGNFIANVTATWSLSGSAGGVASGDLVTAGDGQSAVFTGRLVGTTSLQAVAGGLSDGTGTVTVVAGAAAKWDVTAARYYVRTSTPVIVSAQLEDANGNAVATSNVSVTWSRSTSYGTLQSTTSSTGPNGVATVQFTASGTAGRTNTITARSTLQTSVTGTSPTITSVGTASSIAAYAGTGQTATIGSAVATAPSVRVTDSGGRPVPDIAVTFAVATGGGSATGLTTTTDGSGIATVGGWTLGTVAGSNTLKATSGSLSGSPVTFTATGVAGAATQLAIETAADGSGSAIATRSVTAGTGFTGYAVTRDAYGNFVANAAATWSLSGNSGGVADDDLVAAGDGRSAVFSGHLVGTTSLQAVSGELSDGTGTVTVVKGAASRIVASAGDGQTATVYTTVATDPSVLVTDAGGNPVSGTSVNFAVASGGGTVTGGSATTDASGIATVGSWRLGTAAGANTLSATSGSLSGSPVTFTATGAAGVATKLLVSTPDTTPARGTNFIVTARLADQYNNAVKTSGITVNWTKSGTRASSFTWVTSSAPTTDSTGAATITVRAASNQNYSCTITAASTGLTSGSLSVTTSN
jgi:protocatechuate 3,4-dioxygenase beta subunit